MRAVTVVQVLPDFKFYCMFYFTCDRSFTSVSGRLPFESHRGIDLLHRDVVETDTENSAYCRLPQEVCRILHFKHVLI